MSSNLMATPCYRSQFLMMTIANKANRQHQGSWIIQVKEQIRGSNQSVLGSNKIYKNSWAMMHKIHHTMMPTQIKLWRTATIMVLLEQNQLCWMNNGQQPPEASIHCEKIARRIKSKYRRASQKDPSSHCKQKQKIHTQVKLPVFAEST